MAKNYCYNKILMNFFWGREDEDKRIEKIEKKNWNCPLDIYQKNQHIHILVHGHSSLSIFSLHLVRGPRVL